MGHKNYGKVPFLIKIYKLILKLLAQECIQGAERLVHKHDIGLPAQSPPYCGTLGHTT